MTNAETNMRNYERHAKARKELGKANKAAIFAALAAAKITEVLAEFDGEGDSGQIEMLTVVRDGEPVAMPDSSVTLQQASWGSDEPTIAEVTLREALETLCYDFLEEEHGGWENNEGAFGEFHFNVNERTVRLEFNARYVDTITSDHTF
jgi:hypothetical protein